MNFGIWILLLLALTCPVHNLVIKFNPMDLISKGYTFQMINSIMKELLLTKQFHALIGILKHPAYDFSAIYDEVCKSMTHDIFKEILHSVNHEEQAILLSDRCILKANMLLESISVDEVKLFPVSPLLNDNFSPVLVRPEIFITILEHGLKTSLDLKTKPINFHQWMNLDPGIISPELYFKYNFHVTKLVLSTMNGISFYKVDIRYKKWLLTVLQIHVDILLYTTDLKRESDYWTDILELLVTILSILKCKPEDHKSDREFYDNYVYNNDQTIRNLIIQISGFFKFYNIDNDQNDNNRPPNYHYAQKVIDIIDSLKNSVEAQSECSLLDVFNVALMIDEKNKGLNPDWLLGLISLKLPTDQDGLLTVLKYFLNRNPHETTIECMSNIVGNEFDLASICKSIKSPEYYSNLAKETTQNFIHIRCKKIFFPKIVKTIFISGLLGAVREPQELFKDIVDVLKAQFNCYNISSMSLLQIVSLTNHCRVESINFLDFVLIALETFLKISEFYTITSSSSSSSIISIIPSPIVSFEYISILFKLLIHYGLAGRRAPFEIDYRYFSMALNGNEPGLSILFEEHVVEQLKGPFFRISSVLESKISSTWFDDPDYMSFIISNYSQIEDLNLESENYKILAENQFNWLKQSFLATALNIWLLIYSIFYEFSSDDIFNILFKK